ncbi:MAG: response regulator [Bacteroidota bacterium]
MKRILLVDDDPMCNFLCTKFLEGLNGSFESSIALNGRQALDILMDYKRYPLPDIILLDLNMPVMGGFEFISAFKELRIPGQAKVRIVILSSSDDPVDIRKASEMGIDHYVTKPISIDKLQKVINHNN